MIVFLTLLLFIELFSCFTWQSPEFCNQFYRPYFLTIEQEIFAVLTDTFHKPGFKLHVLVLQHLFCLVMTGPSISASFIGRLLLTVCGDNFRWSLVCWPSHCGMLQQFHTHIPIMGCLFVSTQLSFWVHPSPTWQRLRCVYQ